MEVYEFKRWCEKAVSGIIFPPDRRKVYQELMEHMEDHRDCLLEQGIDQETARDMAVEAMGDPWPIAKDLAAIHRPFWGYALRATRVVLVIALLATIIPFCVHIWNADYTPSMWTSWDLFSEESYGGDTGRTLLHLSEPGVSETSDGYIFTLTDAVRWQTDEYESDCLLLYMKEFHPLPWAGHGEAGGWFWAVSLPVFVVDDHPEATRAELELHITGALTYNHNGENLDAPLDQHYCLTSRWEREGYFRFSLDLPFQDPYDAHGNERSAQHGTDGFALDILARTFTNFWTRVNPTSSAAITATVRLYGENGDLIVERDLILRSMES